MLLVVQQGREADVLGIAAHVGAVRGRDRPRRRAVGAHGAGRGPDRRAPEPAST